MACGMSRGPTADCYPGPEGHLPGSNPRGGRAPTTSTRGEVVRKYAIAVRSWENNWEELATMFAYPGQIRRLIYTTNTVKVIIANCARSSRPKAVFRPQRRLESYSIWSTTRSPRNGVRRCVSGPRCSTNWSSTLMHVCRSRNRPTKTPAQPWPVAKMSSHYVITLCHHTEVYVFNVLQRSFCLHTILDKLLTLSANVEGRVSLLALSSWRLCDFA